MGKYGRYLYSSKSNLSERAGSRFMLFHLLLSAPCHLQQYRPIGSTKSNIQCKVTISCGTLNSQNLCILIERSVTLFAFYRELNLAIC